MNQHIRVARAAVLTAAFAAVGALGTPPVASASYTITKAEAQRYARGAAEVRYGDRFGIRYRTTRARCEPQYTRYDPRYAYHRWKCDWAGLDFEGDVAAGRLRITGHSDGTYGHLVLIGVRWP